MYTYRNLLMSPLPVRISLVLLVLAIWPAQSRGQCAAEVIPYRWCTHHSDTGEHKLELQVWRGDGLTYGDCGFDPGCNAMRLAIQSALEIWEEALETAGIIDFNWTLADQNDDNYLPPLNGAAELLITMADLGTVPCEGAGTSPAQPATICGKTFAATDLKDLGIAEMRRTAGTPSLRTWSACIALNSAGPWCTPPNDCSTSYDRVTVLLHEIGHVLGLDDIAAVDDSCPTALMYEEPRCGEEKRVDSIAIAGLTCLYGLMGTPPSVCECRPVSGDMYWDDDGSLISEEANYDCTPCPVSASAAGKASSWTYELAVVENGSDYTYATIEGTDWVDGRYVAPFGFTVTGAEGRIRAYDEEGVFVGEAYSLNRFTTSGTSSVDVVGGTNVLRASSYPNPFNPRITIEFELKKASRVSFAIYDAGGKLVKVLPRRELPGGTHRVQWLGDDEMGRRVASGVYLYRLEAGGQSVVRKIALLR